MIWKILIGLSAAAIITGGVVWISHGMHAFTHDREEVITIEKDEIFGTDKEVVTWVETFKLGFLPDDNNISVVHRSYAFILGVSGAAIALSILMLRKSRSKA